MEIAYYNILLPVPTEGVYTYFSEGLLNTGERVIVPFGKREITGIVLEKIEKPDFECKEIIMCCDNIPLFSKEYITFLKNIASYYTCPLGLVLHGVLSEKILNIEISETEPVKNHPVKEIILTKEQQKIADNIQLNTYCCHLIKGITGSGKTEIYQEAAKKVINSGKQVLYIVPEISLTQQLIERLAYRLGVEPSIYHYKLTDKARKKHFTDFATGNSKFMLGARSALFVPAKNIGLIIVDEEHESSYKQDEAPSYHLRDMAVMYANILNIPIILGSATPSVESIYNAESGKYVLHSLTERPNHATLPEIKIIDMKTTNLIGSIIAEPVYDELSNVVKRNEQAIILLNRKGYSTYLYCQQCGALAECLNCSVGLVSFKLRNKALCRYCNTEYNNLICSVCGSKIFKEYGYGTEKVEEFLESMFPDKIIRIDTESVSSIKTLNKNLKKFENKEANILVGTQLIAKGLHFPEVTFVGVLGIDNLMALPDFRAIEKAYQLLVQVSGRAGREHLSGRVYIQTMNPEAPVFNMLDSSDLEFYNWELSRRSITQYPPFTKLARLIFSYINQKECYNTAKITANTLKSLKEAANLTIYGPKDATLTKLQNKYRYEILIKSVTNSDLNKALIITQQIFNKCKKGAMRLKIDKDPYFMM
ncbi:MAG: primosomal protein N' [Mucispirillum sp.]|nr:primosomal protein N' [Mucispirillum sp.]